MRFTGKEEAIPPFFDKKNLLPFEGTANTVFPKMSHLSQVNIC